VYAPILEEVYINWGEGNADVQMLGLTPYDDNQVINQYKNQFGVTNPCAGNEGNSGEAIAKIIDGQTFYGYPTYCVVCPDKKLHFGICYPPDPDCFDEYIVSCGATSTKELADQNHEITIFPNPASDFINIEMNGINANRLTIYSPTGKMMKEIENAVSGQNFFISIAGYPGGIYFLKVETEMSILTKKVFIR